MKFFNPLKIHLLFPPKSVLIAGLSFRLICALAFADLHSDYYWEYGEIAKNVISGKGYSFRAFSGNTMIDRYREDLSPLPTAFMSPGYVWVLIPFIALRNSVVANILLILLQTLLSMATIVLVYHFTRAMFNPRAAVFSAIAAALMPDVVYAVISFSPTVFYHAGVIILLFLIGNGKSESPRLHIFLVSVLCAVLIFFRFEFVLYVFLIALLLALERRAKESIVIVMTTICFILPWSARNYEVFCEMVPLGTGAGLNLYRGNNAENIGSWGNEKTNRELLRIPRDKRFELALDSLFREEAWDFVRKEPKREAELVAVKVGQLWLFSPLHPTPYNLVYVAASSLAFILFFVGLLVTWHWAKYKYLYMFLLYSTILAMIFFALPRHQTMMRIGMLPFIGAGVDALMMYFSRPAKLGLERQKTLEGR